MALLQQKLSQSRGRPSGFDYLRVALALGVIVFHVAVICHGEAAQTALLDGPLGPLCALPVPMFFAISGFLVADSLERAPGLGAFLAFRALRIFPALIAVTLFSALVLGPMLSDLPPAAYFRSGVFWTFLLNTLGDVQFYLPGVFLDHPIAKVNAQLWTIPFELRCYIVLALLAMASLHRNRGMVLLCVVLGCVVAPGWQNLFGHDPGPPGLNGGILVFSFLSGTSLWLLRDRIAINWLLFWLCAALMLIFLGVRPLVFLSPVPIAYCTVFIGMLDPARLALIRSGDYSYGLYLLGYPVQQAVISLVPASQSNGILNLAIAIPATFLLAVLSWHFIEKPALGLKRRFRGAPAALPVAAGQTL